MAQEQLWHTNTHAAVSGTALVAPTPLTLRGHQSHHQGHVPGLVADPRQASRTTTSSVSPSAEALISQAARFGLFIALSVLELCGTACSSTAS